MADEYELQRPQLSESDYLAGYRAIGDARASQGGKSNYRQVRKSAPADSGEDGPACEECRMLRRQRAAAAEQVNALARTIESLEEELLFLRKQLASHSIGANADPETSGTVATPAPAPTAAATGTSGQRPLSTAGKASAGVLGHGTPDEGLLPDVLVEGDGLLPTTCLADARPHGLTNIVCTALLPSSPAGALVYAVTGGADKRVVLTCFTPVPGAAPALSYSPTPLTSLYLTAPVLALATRPGHGHGPGLLAASCMDGTVHLIQYSLGDGQEVGCSLSALEVLRAHSKYVTRVAWSRDGRLLATGGSDRSVCIWAVKEEGREAPVTPTPANESSVDEWGPSTLLQEAGALPPSTATAAQAGGPDKVTKLQQVHFAKGSIECLVWCCESEGDGSGPRVDTLACTVRTAPALYYLRVLRAWGQGQGSSLLLQGYSTVLQEACQAQALPLLQPPSSPLLLLLHRVPVSEDGAQVDISWATLGRRGMHEGVQGVCGGRTAMPRLMPHAPPPPMGDVSLHAPAATAALLRGEGEGEGDARRVREQLQDRGTVQSMGLLVPQHAEPSLDGSPAQAARARAEQVAAASAFVPVGFSIVDLSPLPLPLPGTQGTYRYLLAAAADNGMVTVHPWGSNTVLRRCVGHKAGGLTDSPTRLAWLPSPSAHTHGGTTATSYYLAASSSLDNAVVIYSLASGQVACKLGTQYGVPAAHGGVVRDMQPVPVPASEAGRDGPVPMLLTVGFDKRMLLWGASAGAV